MTATAEQITEPMKTNKVQLVGDINVYPAGDDRPPAYVVGTYSIPSAR